ncbi:MAG: hypothetical protein ACW98G_17850, partial [Candidatus Hodarchaeales archaeon]
YGGEIAQELEKNVSSVYRVLKELGRLGIVSSRCSADSYKIYYEISSLAHHAKDSILSSLDKNGTI